MVSKMRGLPAAAALALATLLGGGPAAAAALPPISHTVVSVPPAMRMTPGCARTNLAATVRGVFYFAPTAGSAPKCARPFGLTAPAHRARKAQPLALRSSPVPTMRWEISARIFGSLNKQRKYFPREWCQRLHTHRITNQTHRAAGGWPSRLDTALGSAASCPSTRPPRPGGRSRSAASAPRPGPPGAANRPRRSPP